MSSTYSTNLALELIGTGDQAGTWGNTTNTNLGTLIEQAISGYVTQAVSTGTDTTITIPNGATGVARNMYIELTGTGGASTNLIVPANKKLYFIFNNTSSGQVTVKVSGQTGVSVPNKAKIILVSNGTDVVDATNYIGNISAASANITVLTSASATITNLIATSASITTLTNNPTFSAGTANGVLFLNGSKVATSGSALTFDGTTFGAGTTTFKVDTSSNRVLVNLAAAIQGDSLEVAAKSNGGAISLFGRASDNGSQISFRANGATTQKAAIYGSDTGLDFQTGTTIRATIDTSGNLGLGVVPSTSWFASSKAIQIGSAGAPYMGLVQQTTTTCDGYMLWGARLSGDRVFQYVTTGDAVAAYRQNAGTHAWFNAASGTAGNTISSFTQAMTLDADGDLGIGTTSPSARLHVKDATGTAVTLLNLESGYSNPSGNKSILWTDATNALGRISVSYTASTGSTMSFGSLYNGGYQTSDLMVLTNTGNLGLGVTPSAWGTAGAQKALQVSIAALSYNAAGNTASRLTHNAYYDGTNWKYIASSVGATRYEMTGASAGSTHSWSISAGGTADNNISFTQAMTLDADGDLGVGITSPSYRFQAVRSGDGITAGISGGTYGIRFDNGGTFSSGASTIHGVDSTLTGSYQQLNLNGSVLTLRTGDNERARITSGGFSKFSNYGTYRGAGSSYHEFVSNSDNNSVIVLRSAATNTAQYGMAIETANDQNDATRYFLSCLGNTTERATIRSDGGLANYSANNVNLASDERLKKDISPLASTWGKVKGIEVVNYRYKDCNEGDPLLYGVIAQQVQPIVPDLVVVTREATETEPEYYGIREQPMYWLAIKALQEAMTRIEQLEAKVAALESK